MTRAEFHMLADMRIKEAGVLLAAGELDGAYYLAGYGVECALKACIIKMLQSSENWQEQNFSSRCWTHNLNTLLNTAGLEAAINNAGPVTAKWLVVKDWTEGSRYEHGKLAKDVDDFYKAITDPNDGVLQWLKARWSKM